MIAPGLVPFFGEDADVSILLFKRNVCVDKKIIEATLYVTGIGIDKVWKKYTTGVSVIDSNRIYTLIDVSEELEAAGVSYNLPPGYLAGVRDGAIVLGSSNAVPEPSSWIFLVLGDLEIILTRQFRKKGGDSVVCAPITFKIHRR